MPLSSPGGGIGALVDDPNPHLGGMLNSNGFDILLTNDNALLGENAAGTLNAELIKINPFDTIEIGDPAFFSLIRGMGLGINCDVVIASGESLIINDASNMDSAEFVHDGVNFNTNFVNTILWQIGTTVNVTAGNHFRLSPTSRLQAVSSIGPVVFDVITPYGNQQGIILGSTNTEIDIIGASLFVDTNMTTRDIIVQNGNLIVDFGNLLQIRDAGTTGIATFEHDGTNLITSFVNTVAWLIGLPIKLLERAAAVASTAAYGQFWVRNDTPNIPMFTDDAGGNQKIGFRGTPINTQNGDYTIVESDDGKMAMRSTTGGAVAWIMSGGLPIGFSCKVYTRNANTLTVTRSGTETFRLQDAATNQTVINMPTNSIATFIKYAANAWVVRNSPAVT